MKAATLDRLRRARAAQRPVALATDLASGDQWLIDPADPATTRGVDPALAAAATHTLAEDRSGCVETASGRMFIQTHAPPPRLVVVGAVHITQPLARIAAIAGYGVVVIDPRHAFASDARFPELAISTEWPDAAITALDPDHRTAIVALTHDPKLDDPALAVALRSPAFYIGALGSTRTHAKRRARLAEAGFDEAAIGRVHGPIGLDIGARSPAEIAIAIMAEITQARRRRESARAAA